MTTFLRAFSAQQLEAAQQALNDRYNQAGGAGATGAVYGAHQTLKAPVNGEALAMPVVCTGWARRASDLRLPGRGVKRDSDREAYMQGAMAAMVALGVMTVERANQIAFMTSVGRLEDYVQTQIAKDRPADEPLLDPKTTKLTRATPRLDGANAAG